MAQRVEAVFELRLGGAGFVDVREWARAPKDRDGNDLPPWDVSDSQLWRYIAAADRLCKERFDGRADFLLARHLLRRERLYAHCLEVGDYKGALSVLKDTAELERLYPPLRVRHGGDANATPIRTETSRAPSEQELLAQLSVEELKALRELRLKAEQRAALSEPTTNGRADFPPGSN
jgi:hypothetical protein